MPDNDYTLYTPEFFAAWETFAEELTRYFQMDGPDVVARPRAAEQTRYVLANMALAKLLRSVGQDESAGKFHLLAEALNDLVDGIPHPLFKVEQPTGKPGRRNDTSAVWRTRSSVCIGLEFLIASGMESDEAITAAFKKHRQKLAKLQRPGADLKKSLQTWRKSFATDGVSNDVALSNYKDGISWLKAAKLNHPGKKIREAGERLIAGAAERAAYLA
jgi:hypothetical protein